VHAHVSRPVRSRGQVLVIYAGSIILFVALSALVVDVAWYWVNTLRVQRAADAAALAGAVFLPGDPASAAQAAAKSATQNGYTTGTNGFTVAPVVDANNDRQLDVTIQGGVPTFFARTIGISSWGVTRTADAQFVLPVPMGSPLAYYGVGDFWTRPAAGRPPVESLNNGQPSITDGPDILASQGGWGAIITGGGDAKNGDAYSPAKDAGASNPLYDPQGYMYVVQLPAGGLVKVFDPGFCAMGDNPNGSGSLGAGDHWIPPVTANPVSTFYTLWNTNGKLGIPNAWTIVPGGTSGLLFTNQKGYDPVNVTGSAPAGATSGCDAYHNTWWTIPTGVLTGTYVLEVASTDPNNASTNAENMFAIEAWGGQAVYGNGSMAVYNNLVKNAGAQQFFLAKIDQVTGAGKTALIDIFDIGDVTVVTNNAVLKILAPDGPGATQRTVSFRYTTSDHCNNSHSTCYYSSQGQTSPLVTQLTTTYSNGDHPFDDTWIHVQVPLASTYGSDLSGLWRDGWWQIQYIVPDGGNDTTTWQVSVSGNPVHLIAP
jgi:hypothetical protein